MRRAWTWLGFVRQRWCVGGTDNPDVKFAFGQAYSYPGKYCCAYGGGRRVDALGMGSQQHLNGRPPSPVQLPVLSFTDLFPDYDGTPGWANGFSSCVGTNVFVDIVDLPNAGFTFFDVRTVRVLSWGNSTPGHSMDCWLNV